MAEVYDWFKTFSENYIKPILSNKKVIAMMLVFLCGTSAYTAYDLTGNKLSSGVTKTPVTKTTVVKKAEPAKTTVIEKIVRPVVNCNSDVQAVRNHVKEHH